MFQECQVRLLYTIFKLKICNCKIQCTSKPYNSICKLYNVKLVFKLYFCEIRFTLVFSPKISFGLKKAPSEVLSSKSTISDFHALPCKSWFTRKRTAPLFRGTLTTKIVLIWNFSFVTAILHFRYSYRRILLTVSSLLCKLYRIWTRYLN